MSRPWNLATFFAAFVLATLPAVAQEGHINGTVKDSTGGALPGATVTITNQATNATQTLTTGPNGSYSAAVPPGTPNRSAREAERGIPPGNRAGSARMASVNSVQFNPYWSRIFSRASEPFLKQIRLM